MTLRIPDDLAAQLREEAKSEDRSINSQLVHILREHYWMTDKIEKAAEEEAPKYSNPRPMPREPVHSLEKGR